MRSSQPSNMRIAGVALLLFSAVLLGVGIHHLVATGTCSSTGYSANYGPVPYCPSGTGWWFAFVFGGIIGSLIGALMAGSMGLVFAGIFAAIGFGSLSILLDSSASSGTKVFAAVFGGCFAIVGVVAGGAVILGALRSVRAPSATKPTSSAVPVPTSAFGTPEASSAFGTDSTSTDPIVSAYNASRATAASAPAPALPPTPTRTPTPLDLEPGLRAAMRGADGDLVDELGRLDALHRKGALTDAEFANAKAKLLGGR
jgi:hypothetical protein